MNVPKLVLGGAACIAGTIGLAALIVIKVLDDCAKRNGHRL